jgi:hypothetical protein
MDDTGLAQFSADFHENIAGEAHASEQLREHVFIETAGEILSEYGEIEDCIRSSYQDRGLKIDGYNYDYEFNSLTLIVSHWLDISDPANAKVTDTTVNSVFKRCQNFFLKSIAKLHDRIEIANEAHDLASLIYECRNIIQDVKIILISDGIIRSRPAEILEIDGITVTRVIWDIQRIRQFIQTGERESVDLDFMEELGKPLQCVKQPSGNNSYTTYLTFIPGDTLADIYGKWGTRLLDMNVRVFLSARGNVNKGIRDTIINQPEMFCAYNNGIAVFARELDLTSNESFVTGIKGIRDFQIINGGQTTASLYHTRKKNKAELSDINVLAKVTVIQNPEVISVLVPKISEYSNTQNKVQLADLLANDPPHPELHSISLSMPAPDPTGGSIQTYWFYEKSRGSFEETRNLKARTPAQKKKHDALYPKRQRFDKNKFGKAWHSYLKLPYIVSLGAQKNFARFNSWLREQENEDWTAFFRKTVALVILWNETERIVRKQGFEGYRHNIVTYTLSWLFQLTNNMIDLERIWQEQKISESIRDSIETLCHKVNVHIRDTDKNISEWCKNEECWKKLKSKYTESVTLPDNLSECFICGETCSDYKPSISSEQEAVEFCKSKGDKVWFELAKWLKDRNFLSPKARSQSFNMGRCLSRGREPSVALSIPCMKIWKEAEIRGWNVVSEIFPIDDMK